MKKLTDLRLAVLASPLRIRADKLLTFAEKGKVRSWRGDIGDNHAFLLDYTAHLIVTDYVGAPQDLLFIALDWLHATCPDANPEEALRFHVDFLDHKAADVSIALDLTELIAASERANGVALVPTADPDAFGPDLAALALGIT